MAQQTPQPSSRPRIFDSHMHIIDPHFPLIPNQGYLPPTFTIDDYHARTAPFDVIGGAIVSASFQGFDQTYLLDALHHLPGFVGVTQLPTTVPDEQILSLNTAGVRALRFNVYRGSSASLTNLSLLAHRVFELAHWHVELYIDSRDLLDLAPLLTSLPRVCIDHLGLSHDGFDTLLHLVEKGVFVKATGFGRVDLDLPSALRSLSSINPHALLFGTDLPSTRASRPFLDSDLTLVLDALGEPLGHQVLSQNALSLYRP